MVTFDDQSQARSGGGTFRAASGSSRNSALAWLAVVLIALVGCDESDSDDDDDEVPTSVGITPADFLGEVSCSSNQGALRSYSVTLQVYEDESDDQPFTIGTSMAVPCSRDVLFQQVIVEGYLYTASIDGYEQLWGELIPFGGLSSGSRQMLDAVTGEAVVPRWTTQCGYGPNSAAEAVVDRIMYISSCDPLQDSQLGPAEISFDPTVALGAEPCTVAPTFDIIPDASELPAQSAIPCDSPSIVYQVTGGVVYRFYVSAITETGLKGAECHARGIAGQTVTPICESLSTTGSVTIDLADLTDGDQALCQPGFTYDILLDSLPLNLVPVSCDEVSNIDPLEAGDYTFEIEIRDQGALVADGVSCTATVEPGRSTSADCSL